MLFKLKSICNLQFDLSIDRTIGRLSIYENCVKAIWVVAVYSGWWIEHDVTHITIHEESISLGELEY